MTTYNPALHGEWHGPSGNVARVVHTTADGIGHGYVANGTFVGFHRPGPGRDEAGNAVAEMLSPAFVAARSSMSSEAASRETKRATAVQAIKNEVTRIKAIAPASRTSTEAAILGIAYLLASEE
jgi:hypothetical protein